MPWSSLCLTVTNTTCAPIANMCRYFTLHHINFGQKSSEFWVDFGSSPNSPKGQRRKLNPAKTNHGYGCVPWRKKVGRCLLQWRRKLAPFFGPSANLLKIRKFPSPQPLGLGAWNLSGVEPWLMGRLKARERLPIRHNWIFFASSYRWGATR